MKKLFTLLFLFLILCVSDAYAANISAVDRFQKDDGNINLYLRFINFTTSAKNDTVKSLLGELPTGESLGATAVGAILDLNSRYYGGIIGADASVYGVGKIDSEKNSREILKSEDGDNVSFAKIGQAYLKLKYRGANWSTDAQAGLGRFDAGTIITQDTRLAPSSYQGARGHLNFDHLDIGPLPGKLSLESAYVDRSSPRDNDEFQRITSESGRTIDYIVSYGAIYDLKAVYLKFAQGYAHDFNKNSFLNMTLKAPIGTHAGVMFDVQLYKFEADGNIWEEDLADGSAAYDHDANLNNFNLGFKYKNLRFGITYTKSEADLSSLSAFGTKKVGYAYWRHGVNAPSVQDAWTVSGQDFNNDGEETWQAAAEFSMDGLRLWRLPLDGLKFVAIYKQGSFDAIDPLPILQGGSAVEKRVIERQMEYRLYYRFDEKDYSGLSFMAAYIDYHMNEDFVAMVSAQPEGVTTGREIRFYIDYAF